MLIIYASMLESDEEKDKLTKIYENYYGLMLYIAKGIISDHALAEDAVSYSFETIINNLHNINEIKCHKTRSYIVYIVRSRAINLLKKQGRYKEDPIEDFDMLDNSTSIENELSIKESYDSIVDYIKKLPKSLSDVLYLSLVNEYSIEEISELLEISNDAVRKRLSRAKAQIRDLLKSGGTEYAKR